MCSGTAQLAAALRAHRLYRPTQDPAGHQRLLLQRLADAALQLAQQGQQQEQGGAGAAAVVTAALGVLQGILSVEHRVIQQQLPLLWPLLLSRPAVAGGSGDGDDVAVAVACSLVDAFAELRQLEAMLASLTEALLQPSTWAPASAAPGGAAPIVQSGRFMGALAGAVRQLPSGQVPMPLRLAAAAVPQLPGCGTGASLAVRLYHCCLSSLQVDLTTASAAAKEAAALVAALAPLLAPLLREAAAGAGAPGGGSDSGKKERKKQLAAQAGEGLLPDLLLLYRDGLALHARCAALHPEVSCPPPVRL